jgi:TonB family protein
MRVAGAPLGAVLALVLGTAPCLAADTKPHIDTSGVNMQPAYPASAYGTGERGAVVMAVAVSADGKVNRIRLLQTSGFNDIDRAGIEGVMGWKFIPATHDGANVEGVSTIKLVFQPPDPPPAANGTPPPPAPDIPSPTNVLPAQVTLEAERGKYADLTRPVPCANGRMDVTVEFLHVNGHAALGGERGDDAAALVSVEASSGSEAGAVMAVDREGFEPPIMDFGFQRASQNEKDSNWLTYSFFLHFGTPQTISIYWNNYGLVTGALGVMQRHETQLPKPPDQLRLRVSSMAAKFIDPQIICLPDASER